MIDNTNFETLPVGTKVVFCDRGAYENRSFIFGVVVSGGKNKKNKVQIVEKENIKLNDDGITFNEVTKPKWDKPDANEIYCVTIGKSKINIGMQWLKSYPGSYDGCRDSPFLYGLYDETYEYVDCRDFP